MAMVGWITFFSHYVRLTQDISWPKLPN